jgi:hypothetical protein
MHKSPSAAAIICAAPSLKKQSVAALIVDAAMAATPTTRSATRRVTAASPPRATASPKPVSAAASPRRATQPIAKATGAQTLVTPPPTIIDDDDDDDDDDSAYSDESENKVISISAIPFHSAKGRSCDLRRNYGDRSLLGGYYCYGSDGSSLPLPNTYAPGRPFVCFLNPKHTMRTYADLVKHLETVHKVIYKPPEDVPLTTSGFLCDPKRMGATALGSKTCYIDDMHNDPVQTRAYFGGGGRFGRSSAIRDRWDYVAPDKPHPPPSEPLPPTLTMSETVAFEPPLGGGGGGGGVVATGGAPLHPSQQPWALSYATKEDLRQTVVSLELEMLKNRISSVERASAMPFFHNVLSSSELASTTTSVARRSTAEPPYPYAPPPAVETDRVVKELRADIQAVKANTDAIVHEMSADAQQKERDWEARVAKAEVEVVTMRKKMQEQDGTLSRDNAKCTTDLSAMTGLHATAKSQLEELRKSAEANAKKRVEALRRQLTDDHDKRTAESAKACKTRVADATRKSGDICEARVAADSAKFQREAAELRASMDAESTKCATSVEGLRAAATAAESEFNTRLDTYALKCRSELSDAAEKLRLTTEKLDTDVKLHTSELDDMKNRLFELQGERATEAVVNSKLSRSLDDAKKNAEALSAELAQAIQTVAACKSAADEGTTTANARIEQTSDALRETESKSERLAEEVSSLSATITTLEADAKAWNTRFDYEKQEKLQCQSELSAAVANLKSTTEKLTADVKARASELDDMKTRLQERHAAANTEANEKLLSSLVAAEDQVRAHSANADQLTAELEQARQAVAACKKEADEGATTAKNRVEQTSEALRATESKSESLANEVKSLSATITALEAEANRCKTKVAFLESEAGKKEATIDELRTAMRNTSNSASESTNKEVLRLERELKVKARALDEQQSKLDVALLAAREHATKVERLETTLADATAAKEAARKDKANMTDRVRTATDAKIALEREIKELNEVLGVQEGILEDAHRESAKLETIVSTLQRQLADANTKLTRVREDCDKSLSTQNTQALASAEAAVQAAKLQVEEVKSKETELRAREAALVQTISLRQNELKEAARKDMDAMTNKFRSTIEGKRALEMDVTSLRETVDTQEKILSVTQSDLSSVSAKFSTLQRQLAQATTDAVRAREDCDKSITAKNSEALGKAEAALQTANLEVEKAKSKEADVRRREAAVVESIEIRRKELSAASNSLADTKHAVIDAQTKAKNAERETSNAEASLRRATEGFNAAERDSNRLLEEAETRLMELTERERQARVTLQRTQDGLRDDIEQSRRRLDVVQGNISQMETLQSQEDFTNLIMSYVVAARDQVEPSLLNALLSADETTRADAVARIISTIERIQNT